jgi:hypothetical protein
MRGSKSGNKIESTARPREQIVEYQKWFTGANVERAVFANDSALSALGRNPHNRPRRPKAEPSAGTVLDEDPDMKMKAAIAAFNIGSAFLI